MQKMYAPARIAAIFIIIALLLTIYVSALYNVQVYQPRQYDEENIHRRIVTRDSTIAAARGNIYDRNGVLLASGRPSHNVRLDWAALRGMSETNDVVLEVIYAAMDVGISYVDTFPVTRGAPFEYLSSMTATQRNRLDAYFEYHGIDPEIDVSSLLAWMREHYKIDFSVGILDARLIIGVRYELEIRMVVGTITPYVFASDVSTEFVTYLAERNLLGVYSEASYVREYHTNHAPHVLGYIGLMTAEELEYYRELGYPMTAMVGKVGVEYAFEEYLHGSEGQRRILLNEEGTVLRDEVRKVPEAGQHIYLTLDLNLQIAAENALRTTIEAINVKRREEFDPEDPEEDLEIIPGGAVVVTNVNTGEILASVSYPSYNLSTLSNDWAFLNTDPSYPMLNRATQGRYSPGSTFKMVTALAGLRNIPWYNQNYGIEDLGRYTRYEDGGFTASCWLYREAWGASHGILDLATALECSCNYYFIQVADWLAGSNAAEAAEMLDEASLDLGLGRATGIELPESVGRLANPEVKAEVMANNPIPSERLWYNADVLLSGFGQGVHRFTPIQLANYVATIGNGGTLYSMSFLRRIVSADFSETVFEQTVEVLSQIEDTEHIEMLQAGMESVVTGRRGTARGQFGNYSISVAAKTGTVQSETASMNDGVFVCYAPADNPEIAISVVVEKGGSGGELAIIARMIFDRYFVTESSFLAVPYGQMIP